MSTRPKSTSLPSIVPVNDETRAMLHYAASPAGRDKIENARQEIRDGRGITVTPDYFEGLNRRISNRVARTPKA